MKDLTKKQKRELNKELLEDGLRYCSGCEEPVSIDAFYKNPDKRLSAGFSYASNCNVCEPERLKSLGKTGEQSKWSEEAKKNKKARRSFKANLSPSNKVSASEWYSHIPELILMASAALFAIYLYLS